MRSARREGFVLIAALWLLIALGAVGLDAALRSRTRRLAAANLIDESRARAAAVAGTEYARSRLTSAMLGRADELRAEALSRARSSRSRNRIQQSNVRSLFRNADPAEDPWRAPDELVAPDMAFGDARYTLRIRDTGAALNLNDADEDVLQQFFSQGLRVDYARSDRLAQSIMDWRDEDDIARLNGGERDEYLKAGAPMLPPNRDFASLEELRYVMGMTKDLYDRAVPYLTLIGSGNINVNAAPAPVLMALPGMTEGAATQLVQMREAGQFPRSTREIEGLVPGVADPNDDQAASRFLRMITFTTNEVEILADGRVEGSPIHVQARVVVARSNTGAVVVWQRID
ncbi:MAG: type II secretion system protein GspK [Gemmatimonadota bacterium]|jgi:type II secretory pathway component PulK